MPAVVTAAAGRLTRRCSGGVVRVGCACPGRMHTCALSAPTTRAATESKKSADGRRSSGAGRSLAEVERIELEWQALSCCYNTNTGKKWVLKDIYGVAHPGEMQVGAGCAPAPPVHGMQRACKGRMRSLRACEQRTPPCAVAAAPDANLVVLLPCRRCWAPRAPASQRSWTCWRSASPRAP